jgi:hypothetical protein
MSNYLSSPRRGLGHPTGGNDPYRRGLPKRGHLCKRSTVTRCLEAMEVSD